MMNLELHPVLPLLAAIPLMPLFGAYGRRVLSLLAPALSLLLLGASAPDARWAFEAMQHEWIFWRSDALARIFALAFILYALIAGIYAWTETGRGPKAASMALAAGGVGVSFAGDLLTLYFFWEMLTVSSLFLIWFGEGRGAIRAGFHYAMVHLFGGACLLIGILVHLSRGGLGMEPIPLEHFSGKLILLGLMINAAVPPLHAWLSDAYPRATTYGTVFLAAFTTKSAMAILSRLFPGTELLIWAGAAMALYGVVFAVLENDIRRLLAYHIISQVGYMVCGVGIGTAMALNGSASHAFSHIFYKGLLMMSAGAVIHATGRGKLSELGQLAGPLRWTLLFCMIGAFSISGVPLFNGFISKSMVVSAAAKAHLGSVELMLLVASMGTFLHTGLKLPWFTFFGSDNGARVLRPVPRSMMLAMALAAAICIITGIFPNLLYQLLPAPVDYVPYTADHVIQILQLLVGTALGFWILRAKLGGQPTVTLDTDQLYRGPVQWAVAGAGATAQWLGDWTNRAVLQLLRAIYRFFGFLRNELRFSVIASQAAVLWLLLFCLAMLLMLFDGN